MHKKLIFLFLFSFIPFPDFAQKKLNILFVGNSLTYSNDLPALVSLVANCDSVEITYRVLAFPNYALEDHLQDGHVVTQIKSGTFDFVIVQQGPSSQPEGRAMLLNDGLKLSKLCKENKARLAFYTVWPSKLRSTDFPAVLETYKQAADSTKGVLCNAGKAWLKAWDIKPELKLYAEDDFHPSYQGSLLAAMVIYGSIRRKTNLSFADYDELKNTSLTRTDFNVLLKAAQQTLAESKKQKKAKS